MDFEAQLNGLNKTSQLFQEQQPVLDVTCEFLIGQILFSEECTDGKSGEGGKNILLDRHYLDFQEW